MHIAWLSNTLLIAILGASLVSVCYVLKQRKRNLLAEQEINLSFREPNAALFDYLDAVAAQKGMSSDSCFFDEYYDLPDTAQPALLDTKLTARVEKDKKRTFEKISIILPEVFHTPAVTPNKLHSIEVSHTPTVATNDQPSAEVEILEPSPTVLPRHLDLKSARAIVLASITNNKPLDPKPAREVTFASTTINKPLHPLATRAAVFTSIANNKPLDPLAARIVALAKITDKPGEVLAKPHDPKPAGEVVLAITPYNPPLPPKPDREVALVKTTHNKTLPHESARKVAFADSTDTSGVPTRYKFSPELGTQSLQKGVAVIEYGNNWLPVSFETCYRRAEIMDQLELWSIAAGLFMQCSYMSDDPDEKARVLFAAMASYIKAKQIADAENLVALIKKEQKLSAAQKIKLQAIEKMLK